MGRSRAPDVAHTFAANHSLHQDFATAAYRPPLEPPPLTADTSDYMPFLNADVLLHIGDYFLAQIDNESLYHCSLVDRAFNQVASRCLYRTVVYSPEHYAYHKREEWPRHERLVSSRPQLKLPTHLEATLPPAVSTMVFLSFTEERTVCA